MDLQTIHLEDMYHVQIILLLLFTMKFFGIFIRINLYRSKSFFTPK